MQPGQVVGSIGLSSREGPDEAHQYIIRGSHATAYGSIVGPVGQPDLRDAESVPSLKGPNKEDTGMSEPSHAGLIVGRKI